MIGTEEYNNEIIKNNLDPIICDKNKGLKFKIIIKSIKLCSSEIGKHVKRVY